MKLAAKLLIVLAVFASVHFAAVVCARKPATAPPVPDAMTAENYDALIAAGMSPDEAEHYLTERTRARLARQPGSR